MSGFHSFSLTKKVAVLSTGLIGLLIAQAALSLTPTTRWLIAGVGSVAAAALTVLIVRRLQVGSRHLVDRTIAIEGAAKQRLQHGLNALADGDLTVRLTAGTKPVTDFAGDELGQVHRTVESLRDAIIECYGSYNATADTLSGLVAQLSATAGSVDGAAHNVSSHTAEAGRATNEIASAIADVAQGAERQVADDRRGPRHGRGGDGSGSEQR